jgi:hypothetical protein
MAGHYVLNGCSASLISRMNSLLKINGLVNETAHPANGIIPGGGGVYLGWTFQSRSVLSGCFNETGTAQDRSQLPPHKYYVIPGNVDNIANIDDVIQPSQLIRTTQFRLTNLRNDAMNLWNNGRKLDSLINQVKSGNVSLEIYYIDGAEVS